jgi:hypothetical protein
MDGAHAPIGKTDRKRRDRIAYELKDMMDQRGVRVQGTEGQSYYTCEIGDWTWQRLAEDLMERIDRGKLG